MANLEDPLYKQYENAAAEDSEECVDWDDPEDESAADPEKAAGRASSMNDGEKDDGSLCVAICTLCAAVPALIGSWCWPILVGAIFAVAAGNVNGGLVKFFHGVQVAIMLALMTNIVQFAYWNVQKKRRKQGHWYMYKPVYILILSTFLVLTQPTCMLVIGSWICDGQFSGDQLDPSISACGDGAGGSGYCYADGSFAGTGFLPDGTFNATSPAAIAYSGAIPGTARFAAGMATYYSDGCSSTMHNFFFDGGTTQALVPNTTTGWMIQLFGTYLGFILMFVGVCQATMLHHKIMKKWNAIRERA